MAVKVYDVGYASPPEHTRWKKGQSGNYKGRPPKPRLNFGDKITAALDEEIGVNIDGRIRKISFLDALILRMKTQAIAGDFKSIRYLTDNYKWSEEEDPNREMTIYITGGMSPETEAEMRRRAVEKREQQRLELERHLSASADLSPSSDDAVRSKV